VATASSSPPQLAKTLTAALATAFAALTPTAAHASALSTPDCAASSDVACHLTGVLHVLYIIAAVLAFVLLAVIALAVRIYRKNSAENEQRRP
jgi:tellurite resistance protein TehA-like permease